MAHLKRGVSKNADQLLDLVERGVFDALKKNCLRSMILAVYNPKDPSGEIYECYTFKFEYFSKGRVPVTFVDIMSSKGLNLQMSLQHAHSNLDTGLRQLITLTQNLAPLPKNRYISLKLYYDGANVPATYYPTGFQSMMVPKPLRFAAVDDQEAPFSDFGGLVDCGWKK